MTINEPAKASACVMTMPNLLVIQEIYKSDEPKKILEILSVFNLSK